jgi:hypothetical protein
MHVCPVYGEILFVIGVRKRKLINAEIDKQTLVIRRLRCKECRVIHHELPDIVVPYKRHCAETIERIVPHHRTGRGDTLNILPAGTYTAGAFVLASVAVAGVRTRTVTRCLAAGRGRPPLKVCHSPLGVFRLVVCAHW